MRAARRGLGYGGGGGGRSAGAKMRDESRTGVERKERNVRCSSGYGAVRKGSCAFSPFSRAAEEGRDVASKMRGTEPDGADWRIQSWDGARRRFRRRRTRNQARPGRTRKRRMRMGARIAARLVCPWDKFEVDIGATDVKGLEAGA